MTDLGDIISVRKFFTEDEQNLIYDALSEYQDHEETYDQVRDLMNKISDVFKD